MAAAKGYDPTTDPVRGLGDPTAAERQQAERDKRIHLERIGWDRPPAPAAPPARRGTLVDVSDALLLAGVACMSVTVYWLAPLWTPLFIGAWLLVAGIFAGMGAGRGGK